MGTETKPVQQATEHTPNFPPLRSLIVLSKVDISLTTLFKECGYQVQITTFNNNDSHTFTGPYDMLFVEIGTDEYQGYDMISPFQIENPGANVLTMTRDNQKKVEKRARSLKVDYHLISPYSDREIVSILSHLAVRQKKARRKGHENPTLT